MVIFYLVYAINSSSLNRKGMPMTIHAIIRHYEIGKTEINWLVEFLTINKSYSAYGNPSFFDPSNGNSFISYSQMERGMPVHYGKV